MPISRDDVLSWLRDNSQALAENKDYLTQLDSSIGDADHGVNMDRGFRRCWESCRQLPIRISVRF